MSVLWSLICRNMQRSTSGLPRGGHGVLVSLARSPAPWHALTSEDLEADVASLQTLRSSHRGRWLGAWWNALFAYFERELVWDCCTIASLCKQHSSHCDVQNWTILQLQEEPLLSSSCIPLWTRHWTDHLLGLIVGVATGFVRKPRAAFLVGTTSFELGTPWSLSLASHQQVCIFRTV